MPKSSLGISKSRKQERLDSYWLWSSQTVRQSHTVRLSLRRRSDKARAMDLLDMLGFGGEPTRTERTRTGVVCVCVVCVRACLRVCVSLV